MKSTEQMQADFLKMYEDIISSGDDQLMARLGMMTKRIMRWLIHEEPELAEQAISMLFDSDAGSRNYLTEQEAMHIVSQMQPHPTWTMEALRKSLPAMKLSVEEPTVFNEWALLVTMLMIQSDSGETLREETGWQPNDDRMVRFVYRLALDKLKDQDGVFNIRRYFGVDSAR